MTPEELAARHPKLYHVTHEGALDSIVRHGLLSTQALLALCPPGDPAHAVLGARRPRAHTWHHPILGPVTVSDNSPLNEAKLARCLDDGLTPADWLAILNARVFFFPDRKRLDTLLDASAMRGKPRHVIAFDTLAMMRLHAARTELCPINSGQTLYVPARRGRSIFTPLLDHSFAEWRKLRGRLDTIKEVTVRDRVVDAAAFMVEEWATPPRTSGVPSS